jgi:hypothetical protein
VFSLDDPLFERKERDALQLVEAMAILYKDEAETIRFVTTWGIKEIDITFGRDARRRWDDLIEKLARGRQLRACVQAAYQENKDTPQAKFLEGLLGRKFDLGDNDEAVRFDPWEYLGLFDRSTERTLLRNGLRPLAKPPFPSIVIGILAERADEHDYFVRHASAELLGRFLGNTGASQDSNRLEWSDCRISAEDEIRTIAEQNSSDGVSEGGGAPEQLDKVIARLGPALGSRAAILELSTRDLAQEKMRAKLKEFIGYWKSFAAQPQPPVLYVIVVRYDDADPSPVELEPKLVEVFAEADCILLTPFILSECEPRHFSPWRSEITRLGRKFDERRYDQFVQSFRTSFRLRELKERLGRPEGCIYI